MTPCIIWQGPISSAGYGVTGGRRQLRAHRVAWENAHGPIPDGMHVLHKCDNPPCVNVEHLFLGTHQDNMDDRSAKNRQAQGEQHGRARLTDEEVDAIRESSASDVELARQYGVADSHINNIRHGRRRTQPTHKKGPG